LASQHQTHRLDRLRRLLAILGSFRLHPRCTPKASTPRLEACGGVFNGSNNRAATVEYTPHNRHDSPLRVDCVVMRLDYEMKYPSDQIEQPEPKHLKAIINRLTAFNDQQKKDLFGMVMRKEFDKALMMACDIASVDFWIEGFEEDIEEDEVDDEESESA